MDHGFQNDLKHPTLSIDFEIMLKKKITESLNAASRESESDTPDYILAEYLMTCLVAYELAVTMRDVKAGVDQANSAASSKPSSDTV